MFGLNSVVSLAATPNGQTRDKQGRVVNTYHGRTNILSSQIEWLAFPKPVASNLAPLQASPARNMKRDKLNKYNNILSIVPKVVGPLESAWKEAATSAHLAVGIAKLATWDNNEEANDEKYMGNYAQVSYTESRQLAISALQTVALVSDVVNTFGRCYM